MLLKLLIILIIVAWLKFLIDTYDIHFLVRNFMKKAVFLICLAGAFLGVSLSSWAIDNHSNITNSLTPKKDLTSYPVYQPNANDFPKIIKKFEEFAIKAQEELKVPGFAVAIIQNDKVIYAKGFGVKRADLPDTPANRVDPHTLFEIGSISKSFTSTLAAMAIDQKKFSWNDRVVDLYPDFRMYDPWATQEFLVKDIMTQHSGLAEHAGDQLTSFGFDRKYIIHSLRYFKPVTSFRSSYAYQNTLFLLMNAILEKQTGNSWNKNIEQKIFEPLGMNESSTTSLVYRHAQNVAYAHTIRDGKPFTVPMNWTEYFDWIDVYAPAGGINSTVLDMAKWMQLHLHNGSYQGKQLVSAENLLVTHTPQTILPLGKENITADSMLCYGMGWIYDTYHAHPILWHTGGTHGASTILAISPATNSGIVIFTNIEGSQFPIIAMKTFYDLYFNHAAADWKQVILKKQKATEQENERFLHRPKEPTSPLPLERYLGTYKNDVFGTIIVSLKNGHLETEIGPNQTKFIFNPWSRDTFEMVWSGKEPGFVAIEKQKFFASFVVDPSGSVTGLSINMLDQDSNCDPFAKVK
jgi:CubicO group peptidase (beta-lactamase class C family)